MQCEKEIRNHSCKKGEDKTVIKSGLRKNIRFYIGVLRWNIKPHPLNMALIQDNLAVNFMWYFLGFFLN